jgi:hypothetical protein
MRNIIDIGFELLYTEIKEGGDVGKTIITDDGRFEWDEDKNIQNIEKHGIDFNFAIRIFDDKDIKLKNMTIFTVLLMKNGIG